MLCAAQYHLGAYEDALKTLPKSAHILSVVGEECDPVNVAFRAMALCKIGRIEETKVALGQLRKLRQDEQYAEDIEVQNLLAEAEKLIVRAKQ
jgi:hypothetical protein